MIELTPQERRRLRAQAHTLHPVVSIGQHGLTPQVLHEVDVALAAHGLIKVRVFSDDRALRESLLERIAAELAAAPVQHIGKLLVLWRPPAAEESPPKHKPARRAAGGRQAPRARDTRTPSAVARTARAGDGGSATDRGRRRRAQTSTTATAARPSSKASVKSASARSVDDALSRNADSGTRVREPRGKSAPNPRRRRRST